MKKKIPAHYTHIGDVWLNVQSVESRIGQPDANDCWPWQGGTHNQGYAMIGCLNDQTHYPKMITGQRYVMMKELGRPLVKGENAIHTCSNAGCMNPAHIVLGSLSDRNQNMMRNGRHNPHSGPRGAYNRKQNRKYKYSDDEIRWIRSAESEDIANKYNITKARAAGLRWCVQNGYSWLKD